MPSHHYARDDLSNLKYLLESVKEQCKLSGDSTHGMTMTSECHE